MNYINENRLNFIIENTVDKFIMENAIDEMTKKQVQHSTKSFINKIKDKLEKKSADDNSDKDNNSKDDDEKFGPKDIRKNAKKQKGGSRGNFNAKADAMYNSKINDLEQGKLSDILNNGPFNISKIAQKVFPDHTKEGAQSQLRKELKGEHADSGYKYRLKKHHLQRLRAILSKLLNV